MLTYSFQYDYRKCHTAISSAVDKLIDGNRYYYSTENLLNDLFTNTVAIENFDEKKFIFFKSYIESNITSYTKIKRIFKVINGHAGNYFGEIVKFYLGVNPDLTLFKEINWLHRNTYLMGGKYHFC